MATAIKRSAVRQVWGEASCPRQHQAPSGTTALWWIVPLVLEFLSNNRKEARDQSPFWTLSCDDIPTATENATGVTCTPGRLKFVGLDCWLRGATTLMPHPQRLQYFSAATTGNVIGLGMSQACDGELSVIHSSRAAHARPQEAINLTSQQS
jgi:hypothetical protein